MIRGALLFGDGHLDGRMMWTGDKAEKLTSGVARKERNSLCGLGPREGYYLEAASEDHVERSFLKPRKSNEARPWNIVRERTRGLHLLTFV